MGKNFEKTLEDQQLNEYFRKLRKIQFYLFTRPYLKNKALKLNTEEISTYFESI